MTLEKPWAKPFDELVRSLGSKWGGEVTGYARGTGAEFYYYPEKKDLAVEAVVALGNRAIDLARSMD